MEDQTYPPADDDRYGVQYPYQTASANDFDEDQNYDCLLEEGVEYPIGDGQEIDGTLLPGDYPIAGEEPYTDYRQTRGYGAQRAVKGMASTHAKYSAAYPIQRRGTVPQKRTSGYYSNEVGDYRRTVLNEKLNYGKGSIGSYSKYTAAPDQYAAMSKLKREHLLRSLTDKEYRDRIHELRENQYRKDRPVSVTSKAYYTQEALTHDQLQNTFMKNYKMETRKPQNQQPSIVQSFSVKSQRNPRQAVSPRSDSAAMRDYYYTQQKRNVGQNLDKSIASSGTKGTRSEPVQPNVSVEHKYVKSPRSPREKPYNSPRNIKTPVNYSASINYDAMLKEVQKIPKHDDTDLEIKYKNDDFGKTLQDDTDPGGQERDATYQPEGSEALQSSVTSISQLKEDTSEDKMMSSIKNVGKLKGSARSNRSKKSNNTIRSKRYEDLVKLQKSKCTVMSVIYDGIQKCEQSKYEYNMPTSKYSRDDDGQALRSSKQSQTVQIDTSQDKSFSSSSDVMNSELIANMFKEFRDYHLQNISQEVKRIQYLDVLPQKLSQLHGT